MKTKPKKKLVPTKNLQSGALQIFNERSRQILKEGYCEDHDDKHDDGELISAAVCYCLNANRVAEGWPPTREVNPSWPWDADDWKPKDPIRDLVRAGALIAAEIDRLQRIK